MKCSKCYGISQESLERFAERFNKFSIEHFNGEVLMIPNDKETYRTDGQFVLTGTDITIDFDWTYRNRWYETKGFPFETIREWQRKLNKKEIGVFLHSAQDESAICVSFRNYFDDKEWQEGWCWVDDDGKWEREVFKETDRFYEISSDEDLEYGLYRILRQRLWEKKFNKEIKDNQEVR